MCSGQPQQAQASSSTSSTRRRNSVSAGQRKRMGNLLLVSSGAPYPIPGGRTRLAAFRPVEEEREGTRMKEFDHVGIVTNEPREGESWVPFSKVWVTNPRLHPQRIEYIRPLEAPQVDPARVGLWKLWHLPHVAYRVDDLEEALRGE